MKNTIKGITLITAALVLFTFPAYGQHRVKPFNRIVILLDGSGSYKDRRAEALTKAEELVQKISEKKTKSYEGKDEVVVISLDSIPETLWSGTKAELAAQSPGYWKQRFAGRSDYEKCTDVESGFLLAARELHKEPRPTNAYLFAFSDLVHEPPLESAKKCRPVSLPSVPSDDFAWDVFSDVETHVLWVPVDQKKAWFEAVNAAKLGDSFHLHSESESSVIELKAPPKARRVMTDEERSRGKEKVKGFLGGIVKAALTVFGTSILLVCGLVFLRRMKNTRRGR